MMLHKYALCAGHLSWTVTVLSELLPRVQPTVVFEYIWTET